MLQPYSEMLDKDWNSLKIGYLAKTEFTIQKSLRHWSQGTAHFGTEHKHLHQDKENIGGPVL